LDLNSGKVERGNLGTIRLDLKFEKVETKAWRKGQRYKRFERLLIDKSGRVLWR
jgi:hypothetical protein